jgi:ferrous iron transport protein B
MWDRASQYLRKMGGIILAFSIIIWFLGEYPTSPDIAREYDARILAVQAEGDNALEKARLRGASEESLEAMRAKYRGRALELEAEKATLEKRKHITANGRRPHPGHSPLGFTSRWAYRSSPVRRQGGRGDTMGVLYTPNSETGRRPASSRSTSYPKTQYGITPLVAYKFIFSCFCKYPALRRSGDGKGGRMRWAFVPWFYQLALAWTWLSVV